MAESIYKKMSDITTEIQAVAKNLEVGYGQSKYKAVGEADVLAAVKPIERNHGVYSYPISREVIDHGEITNTRKDGTESHSLYLRVTTTYRFVNIDDPQEYIDIISIADGVDTQDKAPGKAMTYADKYALLKAYKIITGDDPDQAASEPLKAVEQFPDLAEPATEAQKRTVYAICKAHNINLGDLYSMNGMTEASATKEQASKLISSLKHKYEA